MFNALLRTLSSSTFLSGLLAIAAQIICNAHGIELPPVLTAMLPAAVGVKEGMRHLSSTKLVRVHAENPDDFELVMGPSPAAPARAPSQGDTRDALDQTRVRNALDLARFKPSPRDTGDL